MVAHKNIILPLGTMFLIVALKIHNIAARTINDLQQPQPLSPESYISISPSTSSSFSKTVPNLNEPLLSSKTLVDYVSLMKTENESMSQTHFNAYSSSSEPSVLTIQNIAKDNFDSTASFMPIASTDPSLVTDLGISANGQNFHLKVPTDTSNGVLHQNGPKYSDMRIDEFAAEADSVTRSFKNENITEEDLRKAIESPLVAERGEKSHLAIEKVAIENFGKEVQKLKENVNSFKDNLRKMLFEGESVMNAKAKEPRTTTASDNLQESSIAKGKNLESTSNSEQISVTSEMPVTMAANPKIKLLENNTREVLNTVKVEDKISIRSSVRPKAAVQHDFSKVSAVASNISEVSRRVGAFLQKQYRESSAGMKNRAQNEIISKGKYFANFLMIYFCIVLFPITVYKNTS